MAFSFGNLLKNFGGKSAEGSVVGIDIGASSAKVVQLRSSRGTAILETYGEIALGPYAEQPICKVVKLTPEKTAEALTDLMKEANVTSRNAGISIPFSSSPRPGSKASWKKGAGSGSTCRTTLPTHRYGSRSKRPSVRWSVCSKGRRFENFLL